MELRNASEGGGSNVMDLLVMVEWVWCQIVLTHRGFQRTLILVGGAISSGYTASVIAPWLERTLTPPTSPAFRWALAQVQTNAVPAGAIHNYVPPLAAATGQNTSMWIASHVLLSILYVLITLSIFSVFVTVAMLRETLWDIPNMPVTRLQSVALHVLATAASTYLTVIFVVLVGNLAWLKDFAWIAEETAHSLAVTYVGHIVALVL